MKQILSLFPLRHRQGSWFGRFFLGDHDYAYKVYMSTGRDDNVDGNIFPETIKDFATGGNLKLSIEVLDELKIGFSAYKGADKSKELVAVDAISDPTKLTSIQADDFTYEWRSGDQCGENDFGFDFKIAKSSINFQAEANFQLSHNLDTGEVTPINAFYLLPYHDIFINKNFGVTPYYFFEKISWTDPQLSPKTGLNGLPFLGWNQHALGLNFRFFSNVHLKIKIYVIGDLKPLNNPKKDGSDEIDTELKNSYGEDDLNIKTLSAGFSIVF